MRNLLLAALLLAGAFAGCTGPEDGGNGTATPTPDAGVDPDQACKANEVADPRGPYSYEANATHGVRVRFETTLGNLTVETDAEHAPRTAENFLRYVDDGFYACTTFHRIAPEATTEERNVRWSLSMARTSQPDSATSQFFVNLADNRNLDPTGPRTGYAVFAHLVEGQDTIDAMLDVPAGQPFGAGGHYPAEPIVILSARRV
jgi:peptidyl-prolyl cis-trans isomerase A (cyclophilin A)